MKHVNLIFFNLIFFFSNGLLCVKDFGILMKRNSMATERQCNTYNQKTRAARKSSPRHKVKIHHFFFLIYSNTVYLPVCVTYHKGAFIIYLEGGLWWFWGGWGGGGHSFSLLWFRGGCGKFPTKTTSSIMGGQPFFGFASF